MDVAGGDSSVITEEFKFLCSKDGLWNQFETYKFGKVIPDVSAIEIKGGIEFKAHISKVLAMEYIY
jgi:hypothetical protein